MSWSAIFLVTLLLMSSKPVTSSHNVRVARPSKVVKNCADDCFMGVSMTFHSGKGKVGVSSFFPAKMCG